MLNFLTSISSSILLYIIAGLLTTTLLFGGLCWYLKGVADQDKASLGVAQDANKTLENSLDLKTKSCEATDKQLAEYQTSKASVEEAKNAKVSAIDALPRKQVTVKANTNEKDVVDIDGALPSDLVILLKQSNSAVKGSVSINAK